MGFGLLKPFIFKGKLSFFEIIFIPNFFNGCVTLVKSLLDKLLSPMILIFFYN